MYKINVIQISTAEVEVAEALSAEDAKEIAKWAVRNKYVTFKEFATSYEVVEA